MTSVEKPQRLRLPKFLAFPWDMNMMKSSQVINEPESPFTALARVEAFKPQAEEAQAFKEALGVTGVVSREGPRIFKSGCARASSFLVAYRLLDIHHRLRIQPTPEAAVTYPPTGPLGVQVSKLGNWPSIVENFHKTIDCEEKYATTKILSRNHKLQCFVSVLEAGVKYATICMNFSFAVLHLRAMFDGNMNKGIPDLPEEKSALLKAYSISDEDTATHRYFLTKSANKLRTPLQTSVLVTPIILLSANRLDNNPMGKDELISLFLRLGNSRPAVVRALEDRIWRTLFALAKDQNSTSGSITSALRDISNSAELKDALEIREEDAAFNAFIGQDPPTTQMIQTPAPDSLYNYTSDASSQAMGAFNKPSDRLDKSLYSASDFGINAFASPAGDTAAGGLSPRANCGVENDVGYWNSGAGDVDMADVQHDSTAVGELGGHSSDQPDVVMFGPGFEDWAREGGRSGEGRTGYLFSSHQTVAPLRNRASDVNAAEEVVRRGAAFARRELGGAQSNDDDEAMGGERVDIPESQRGVEGDSKALTDRADKAMDEEESEDEQEASEKASPKMGEDEDGTQGDAEGDSMGEEDGTDEKQRPNKRIATLHIRPTQGLGKNRGKVIHRPITGTSRRRSKAIKKTRSALLKSRATIEDEDDGDADADGSPDPGEDGSTEEEAALFEEKIADDIWIRTRRCTLDLQERPKIQCNTEINAYGASKQAIKINIEVHDTDILNNIELLAKAVKESYRDGVPLHVHPTAQEESVFHLVTEAGFKALSGRKVQDILRKQHIVIHAQSHNNMTFKQALQTLGGGLERVTEIQDQSLASEENCNKICRVGTLRDLLTHANSPTGNALNALDFPMGHVSMAPTSFASDTHALLRTANHPTWDQAKQFPAGHFRWGLAATAGAFHAFHIDSNGLATYISPQTGSKWWVVARPIRNLDHSSFEDMGLLLDEAFSVNGNGKGIFALEAILLEPGTTLIMRPNTIHAVYTPQSSVVHGGHFFATSTMRDTLAATFHTTVLNELMTNTDHHPAYACLRRLIDLFHCTLVEGKMDEDDPSSDHVPDLRTLDGLLDLLSICTLGMLLSAIDLRTYGNERMAPYEKKLWDEQDVTPLPLEDRLANQYARGQCTDLLRWADDEVSVIVTSHGKEEEQAVADFQKQLFAHHLWLLHLYKHSVDQGDFVHSPNFNGKNLKTQLTSLWKNYCMDGSQMKAVEGHISSMDQHQRTLFPFLDGVTVRPKPKRTDLSCTLPPTSNTSKVKRLLELGHTERDGLYEIFLTRIKSEKTDKPDAILHRSKKRKLRL